MDDAIRNAPIGVDGERVIRLKDCTGIVAKFAASRIPHYGDYRFIWKDAYRVRVVA